NLIGKASWRRLARPFLAVGIATETVDGSETFLQTRIAMMSISIAMATYNGQRHIQRQLDSLAAQTHLPAELVVSDDMSSDETLKIVDAFAKTAPFQVRIYQSKTRLGYRANFMRAAGLCQSDLIAFCDQDDYWYPNKIATCIEAFNDREVLLACHN